MTQQTKLKIGIVGLGNMGRNHARIASSHSLVEHTVIFDMDSVRTQNIASSLECERANNYEDLLSRADAVVIASSTLSHFALAKAALEAGRHCLIEKPITASVEEAQTLIDIASAKGLIVSVGHVERYNPVFPELRKIVSNETILAVAAQRLSYNLSRANDVSVVLDLMIHDIDTIAALSDSTLTVQSAIGGAFRSKEADYVSAHLTNGDNMAFTLVGSKISQTRVRNISISCEDCFIEADYLKKEIQIFRNASGKYLDRSQQIGYRQEALVERVLVPNAEPLAEEHSDFYNAIINGSSTLVTAQHGKRALVLADQIERTLK